MENKFTKVFLFDADTAFPNRFYKHTGKHHTIFTLIILLLSLVCACNAYTSPQDKKPKLINFGNGAPVPHVMEYANAKTYFLPDINNNAIIHEPSGTYKISRLGVENDQIYFEGFPKMLNYGNYFSAQYSALICNMDQDADLEIVVSFGAATNDSSKIYAWNFDSTIVPGWPKTIPFFAAVSPAFGDIDGDGQKEIIVNSYDKVERRKGSLFAFRKNGEIVQGFPISDPGFYYDSPVLVDLDNDGKLEIIINRDYPSPPAIEIYRGDGTMFPGWPYILNERPASSTAAGDINGDSIPEIVVETLTKLFVLNTAGEMLPGFPYLLERDESNSYSSPVLADLDNDGKREIIFGSHTVDYNNQYDSLGHVHILKYDGSVFPNWPRPVKYWVYGPPSVGYIDDDNLLDIAVGDCVLSEFAVNAVSAWNLYGEPLNGFPILNQRAINSQVTLGDIDKDNRCELLVDDNLLPTSGWGAYHGFNNDGSVIDGWPLLVEGTTFYKSICLADVDGNGTIDLVGNSAKSTQNYIHLWNTHKSYDINQIYMPIFQYNERHDGVFLNRRIIGIQNHQNNIAKEYKLYQNFPNPFNPQTAIQFDIPKNTFVNLTIYDVLGRKIDVLYNGVMQAGKHEITWNAYNYSSGVYFYRLEAGNFSETKKMILTK